MPSAGLPDGGAVTPRLRRPVPLTRQLGQGVPGRDGVGVVGPEDALADGEGALEEGAGGGGVALVAEQDPTSASNWSASHSTRCGHLGGLSWRLATLDAREKGARPDSVRCSLAQHVSLSLEHF